MGAKKIILIVVGSVFGLILLGVGGIFAFVSVFGISVEEYEQQQTSSDAVSVEPINSTGIKDNQKLKDSAIEANYEEIYIGNYNSTDTYKITGTVGDVGNGNLNMGDQFMLSQDEGDINGSYAIKLLTEANINEGDTITVYGFIEEDFADNGAPILNAAIVE